MFLHSSFEKYRACWPRRAAHRCIAALLLLVPWTVAPARADECLLPPVAVPGLSGPPRWYGAGSDVRTELDDPRWGGAPLQTFASDPSGASAAYRVLVSNNQLSVSFQALVEPGSSGDDATDLGDAVYLGITTNDAASGAARILEIRPERAGASDPIAWTPSVNFKLWSKTAASNWGSPSTPNPPPAFPQDAGVFTVHTWRNSPVGAVWAVNFKVDLAGVLSAPGTAFRLAFAMRLNTPGGAVNFVTPEHPVSEPLVAGTLLPANTGLWPLHLPAGTACTAGVSISPMTIGSLSPNGPSFVDNGPNTFFADVTGIAAPVTANKVLARFSIADWGSQVAVPSAGWKEFSISANGDGYVPDASTGAAATWTSPSPSSPGDTTSARITYRCTPEPSATYCPRITASNPNRDQCLLVELKEQPGPRTLAFRRGAVYRNLTFAHLSTLDRDASISIRGLQALTGQARDRDVYLYVQTKNLPAPSAKEVRLPFERMDLTRRYAEAPSAFFPRRRTREALAAGAAENPEGAGAPSSLLALSPEQALLEAWPSYIVHAYYDTGRTMQVNGVERPVLEPMVPFGFFLTHAGSLYGFTHAIRGLDGVTLEEIAPSFYRVHIGNEGSVRVATRITAEEKPPGSDPGGPPCCAPPPGVVHGVPKGCLCGIPGARSTGTPLGVLLLIGLVLGAELRRRGRREG